MDSLTAAFVANVRRILESRGLSQRAFAGMLGVSQPTLCVTLSGRSHVSLGTVERYAAALGVKPCELLCPASTTPRTARTRRPRG